MTRKTRAILRQLDAEVLRLEIRDAEAEQKNAQAKRLKK